MTKAIWIVAGAIMLVALIQYAQYRLDYNYLYDNIPMCKPEKKEIEV